MKGPKDLIEKIQLAEGDEDADEEGQSCLWGWPIITPLIYRKKDCPSLWTKDRNERPP